MCSSVTLPTRSLPWVVFWMTSAACSSCMPLRFGTAKTSCGMGPLLDPLADENIYRGAAPDLGTRRRILPDDLADPGPAFHVVDTSQAKLGKDTLEAAIALTRGFLCHSDERGYRHHSGCFGNDQFDRATLSEHGSVARPLTENCPCGDLILFPFLDSTQFQTRAPKMVCAERRSRPLSLGTLTGVRPTSATTRSIDWPARSFVLGSGIWPTLFLGSRS